MLIGLAVVLSAVLLGICVVYRRKLKEADLPTCKTSFCIVGCCVLCIAVSIFGVWDYMKFPSNQNISVSSSSQVQKPQTTVTSTHVGNDLVSSQQNTENKTISSYKPIASSKPFTVSSSQSVSSKPSNISSSSAASSKPVEEPKEEQTLMVWIVSSGEKFHLSPYCSNMKFPYQVTVDYAWQIGRTPCKKCFY